MTSDSSAGRTPDELVSQVRFLEAEVGDLGLEELNLLGELAGASSSTTRRGVRGVLTTAHLSHLLFRPYSSRAGQHAGIGSRFSLFDLDIQDPLPHLTPAQGPPGRRAGAARCSRDRTHPEPAGASSPGAVHPLPSDAR